MSLECKEAIAKETGQYGEYRDAVIDAYKNGEISAEEARDRIERAMADMSDSSKQTFTKNLPSDIKKGLDPNKYDSAFTKFKRAWNNFINGIKKKIGMEVEVEIESHMSSNRVIHGGGGKSFNTGGVFYPSKLPKLAPGGIINQPGRGMPYNGAIIGERGAEAIVPLTDSQQMALLGEAIGKYININATIPVYVANRQVAREIRKINADDDFAYNA